MFTSISAGPACATRAAVAPKSSTVSAEMLAIRATPSGSSARAAARRRPTSSSAPGLGSPIALSSPCPQSTARRVAMPPARRGRARLCRDRPGAAPGGARKKGRGGAPDARCEHERGGKPDPGRSGRRGQAIPSAARTSPRTVSLIRPCRTSASSTCPRVSTA